MIFVISIIVYILINLFLNKTIFGKAIRAGIENPDQVRQRIFEICEEEYEFIRVATNDQIQQQSN